MFHRLKTKVAELYMTAALLPIRFADLHFSVKIYDRYSRLGGEWNSSYLIPDFEDILTSLTEKKINKKPEEEELFDDYEA